MKFWTLIPNLGLIQPVHACFFSAGLRLFDKVDFLGPASGMDDPASAQIKCTQHCRRVGWANLVQRISSCKLPWHRWHWVQRRVNFSSNTFSCAISFWNSSDSLGLQCSQTTSPARFTSASRNEFSFKCSKTPWRSTRDCNTNFQFFLNLFFVKVYFSRITK